MTRSRANKAACSTLLLLGIFSLRYRFAASETRADSAISQTTASDSHDESEIRQILNDQTAAWNRGDIDAFMNGYWKSKDTLFVGAKGVTRGWEPVLERYHHNYPDQKAMGHLTFSNLEIHKFCADAALAVGNFRLDRERDHPEGVFTLDFRGFPEGWRIVADHTTAFSSQEAGATH